MCGIVGVTGTNIHEINIFEAAQSMKHRGPDSLGSFTSECGNIKLGHTRLSIIDLQEHANQPMISADNRYVLVFNGEIYNFLDLRKKLSSQGVIFKSNSDTEVLLQLLILKRAKAFNMLNGIFSLAFYDSKYNLLLLAKDHFGVKPLYYKSDNGRFYFSSEVRGLISMGVKIEKIDAKACLNHINFIWNPSNNIVGGEIKQLEPGTFILIEGSEIKKKVKYYTPKFKNFKSIQKLNVNQIVVQLSRKIEKAVVNQLVSDVPLGGFLSGGLDSSAVAYFANKHTPGIPFFTINAGNSKSDTGLEDLQYARYMAKKFELNLLEVNITAKEFLNDMDKMVDLLEEPIADPASLNVYYISKKAREMGIKVLLSGVGGDDLFTGYRRHKALYLFTKIDNFPFGNSLLSSLSSVKVPFLFNRKLSKFLSSFSEREDRIFKLFLWGDLNSNLDIFRKEFLDGINENNIFSEFEEFLKGSIGLDPLDKMLSLEQRFFLGNHNLLYTDKMSMAVGVEVRVPFLDKNLANFANSIPNELKQRGLTGKWIFKKSMEGKLPKEIIHRQKSGFGLPLRQWVKNDLSDFIDDVVNSKDFSNRGVFDQAKVKELILKNKNNLVDASYNIMSIIFIELWLRKHNGPSV